MQQLVREIKSDTIVVLTGMRRVGKSTLFNMLFDKIPSTNKVYLDIENPIDQQIFEENDYRNIIANLKTYGIRSSERIYVFLDEIQAYPPIVKAIKYLHDHYRVKFFVTGSSSFYLKNLFPESLAGRKRIFELMPLTFGEYLVFKDIHRDVPKNFDDVCTSKNKILYEKYIKHFDEYVLYGGFPQVVLTEHLDDKKHQLKDIFKSYFEKDVVGLAHFRDVSSLRDVILLLLQRVGSKLDISKISSEIGISRETVYSYLSFLEATYFIYLITPYSQSVEREVSGGRKVYVCDTGFINHFAHVDAGNCFENAVFLNLKKYGPIRYYEKRNAQEIDFILKDIHTAIEVKSKGTPQQYTKLVKTAESLGLAKSYMITRTYSADKNVIPAVNL